MKVKTEDASYVDYFSSPIGLLEVLADDNGVTALRFVDQQQAPRDSDFTKTVLRQLSEYFDGNRNKFDLPLAAQGTAFQKRVWAALMEIPSGTTASYADIAQKVESPKAVRAVGAANGQNPIGIIVPCHRIIGSNGKLTGYAFGLEKKAWLLQHEGAILLLNHNCFYWY